MIALNQLFVATLLALYLSVTSHGFTFMRDGTASPRPGTTVFKITTTDADSVVGTGVDTYQSSFKTAPMKTYMEDIDAYGVMWHVNYLLAYDRALHSTLSCKSERPCTTVLDHEDWSIVQVNKQRFKTAIRLGDSYLISGKLVSRSGDSEDCWEVTMHCAEDEKLIFNSATVTVSRPKDNGQFWLPNPEPFDVEPVGSYTYQTYRDEFDAHLTTHLPLTSAMNHMERSRTNHLGGPDLLRKMQEECNIVWYVISADEVSLVQMDSGCSPGREVISQLAVKSKRKGMILEIHHTLIMPTSNGPSRKAQGKVTLMAFNEALGKPTSDIPEWCLKKLGIL
jgi:acyl-CoA thioesterase FadM